VKFILEQAMKARMGVEYSSALPLTSALDRGGWRVKV
jgi:hypothetical protein